MSSKEKTVEHEKVKQFQAPKGVFVGIGPDFNKVGRLRDVGMDGLVFRYLGNGDALNGSYVDVFMTEGDFYLGKVPIKIMSDVEVVEKASPDSKTLRQCHVTFEKLTSQQKAKLKEFIDRYAVGEA
ncbi:MAG: hypothetical protein JRF69_01470 [Deltaproteobacteria bacterium]|nr:hypothetical protein [Deltaproteobacteria bacterium]